MDLKQHRIESGLLSYELALHVVDPGTSAHDHAAAEEELGDEDQNQIIGVL